MQAFSQETVEAANDALVNRLLAERSLHHFMRQAWPLVESAPFIDNWHIQAICKHLEAVTRGEILRLLINIPPSCCKPVWEEEFVLERTKGRIRLRAVLVGDEILTHRGRFRKVLEVHEQGELPLLAVTTHTNRTVRTADDHPFLTPRGWIQAKDLRDMDVLACVAPLEQCGTNTVTAEEARVLGYLIGDGCCKYATPVFTNEDPLVLDDFEKCAASIGFKTRRKLRDKHVASTIAILPDCGEQKKWHKKRGPHPVVSWLRKHGIEGSDSYSKRVPPAIMAASPRLVAEFVGAYWSCDGHIAKRGGSRSDCVIGADSVSEGLIRDVQHLLSRLGVLARVRRKQAKIQSKRQGALYVSWQLVCSTLEHGSKFAAVVPVKHSLKSALLNRFTRSCFDRELHEDPLVSVVPDGAGLCRCLTIDEDESFVVNDIAVHNSLIVAVMWMCWEWTTRPETRWFFASYDQRLSTRDSVRCRTILESEWYQQNWPVHLSGDQNLKCLVEGTQILMADGTLRPIESVRRGDKVQSSDGYVVRDDTVLANLDTGVSPVYRVILSDGTELEGTWKHRIFGWDGWVRIGELKVGDPVCVLRRSRRQVGPLSVDDAFLLAFWLAEGSKSATNFRVASKSAMLHQRLAEICNRRGWQIRPTNDGSEWSVSAGRRRLGDTPFALLRSHGLLGMRVDDIRVPPAVFQADESAIREFIGTYIACDGCVTNGKNHLVSINSASRRLISDLQLLFKRIGVQGMSRCDPSWYSKNGTKKECRPTWSLAIRQRESLLRMADLPVYHKAAKLADLVRFKKQSSESSMTVPPAWRRCLSRDENWHRTEGQRIFTGSRGWATRSIATSVARQEGNVDLLRKLSGDLEWRPVKSILYVGKVQTYDIQTESHNCFFANGVLSHNTYYENTDGGYRMATSVGGHGTGEHPDRIIYDDVNNAKQAESEQERESVLTWHDLTMSTRGIARNAARVIIAQRLHEQDISGHVLAKGDWVHICLPMRFEPGRMQATPLGWNDPRTVEGELLFPEMLSAEVVRQTEANLGSYGTAGQLQQRPAPGGGGIFNRKHFRYASLSRVAMASNYADQVFLVLAENTHGGQPKVRRFLLEQCPMFQVIDTAWKDTKTAAYTAVGTFVLTPDFDLVVYDFWRAKLPPQEQFQAITAQRNRYPRLLFQAVEEAASGQWILPMAAQYGIAMRSVKPWGSKEARAATAATLYERGKVWHMANAAFLTDLEDELVTFPTGKYADQVDCLGHAANLAITDALLRRAAGTGPELMDDGQHDGIQTEIVVNGHHILFDDDDDLGGWR